MSKCVMSGSATEQWHWRVLFSDGEGGREPDRSSRLPNLVHSRSNFTSQNCDFLRATRNPGDLDIFLYHKEERIVRKGGLKMVRFQTRDPDQVNPSYLGISRRLPVYIDFGDFPNPSLGPNFNILVASRCDLRRGF